MFPESVCEKPDNVGVLFEISVDPTISSAAFACVKDISNFREEDETLFFMHTVFRIGEIVKISHTLPLYQVNLTLTYQIRMNNSVKLRHL